MAEMPRSNGSPKAACPSVTNLGADWTKTHASTLSQSSHPSPAVASSASPSSSAAAAAAVAAPLATTVGNPPAPLRPAAAASSSADPAAVAGSISPQAIESAATTFGSGGAKGVGQGSAGGSAGEGGADGDGAQLQDTEMPDANANANDPDGKTVAASKPPVPAASIEVRIANAPWLFAVVESIVGPMCDTVNEVRAGLVRSKHPEWELAQCARPMSASAIRHFKERLFDDASNHPVSNEGEAIDYFNRSKEYHLQMISRDYVSFRKYPSAGDEDNPEAEAIDFAFALQWYGPIMESWDTEALDSEPRPASAEGTPTVTAAESGKLRLVPVQKKVPSEDEFNGFDRSKAPLPGLTSSMKFLGLNGSSSTAPTITVAPLTRSQREQHDVESAKKKSLEDAPQESESAAKDAAAKNQGAARPAVPVIKVPPAHSPLSSISSPDAKAPPGQGTPHDGDSPKPSQAEDKKVEEKEEEKKEEAMEDIEEGHSQGDSGEGFEDPSGFGAADKAMQFFQLNKNSTKDAIISQLKAQKRIVDTLVHPQDSEKLFSLNHPGRAIFDMIGESLPIHRTKVQLVFVAGASDSTVHPRDGSPAAAKPMLFPHWKFPTEPDMSCVAHSYRLAVNPQLLLEEKIDAATGLAADYAAEKEKTNKVRLLCSEYVLAAWGDDTRRRNKEPSDRAKFVGTLLGIALTKAAFTKAAKALADPHGGLGDHFNAIIACIEFAIVQEQYFHTLGEGEPNAWGICGDFDAAEGVLRNGYEAVKEPGLKARHLFPYERDLTIDGKGVKKASIMQYKRDPSLAGAAISHAEPLIPATGMLARTVMHPLYPTEPCALTPAFYTPDCPILLTPFNQSSLVVDGNTNRAHVRTGSLVRGADRKYYLVVGTFMRVSKNIVAKSVTTIRAGMNSADADVKAAGEASMAALTEYKSQKMIENDKDLPPTYVACSVAVQVSSNVMKEIRAELEVMGMAAGVAPFMILSFVSTDTSFKVVPFDLAGEELVEVKVWMPAGDVSIASAADRLALRATKQPKPIEFSDAVFERIYERLVAAALDLSDAKLKQQANTVDSSPVADTDIVQWHFNSFLQSVVDGASANFDVDSVNLLRSVWTPRFTLRPEFLATSFNARGEKPQSAASTPTTAVKEAQVAQTLASAAGKKLEEKSKNELRAVECKQWTHRLIPSGDYWLRPGKPLPSYTHPFKMEDTADDKEVCTKVLAAIDAFSNQLHVTQENSLYQSGSKPLGDLITSLLGSKWWEKAQWKPLVKWMRVLVPASVERDYRNITWAVSRTKNMILRYDPQLLFLLLATDGNSINQVLANPKDQSWREHVPYRFLPAPLVDLFADPPKKSPSGAAAAGHSAPATEPPKKPERPPPQSGPKPGDASPQGSVTTHPSASHSAQPGRQGGRRSRDSNAGGAGDRLSGNDDQNKKARTGDEVSSQMAAMMKLIEGQGRNVETQSKNIENLSKTIEGIHKTIEKGNAKLDAFNSTVTAKLTQVDTQLKNTNAAIGKLDQSSKKAMEDQSAALAAHVLSTEKRFVELEAMVKAPPGGPPVAAAAAPAATAAASPKSPTPRAKAAEVVEAIPIKCCNATSLVKSMQSSEDFFQGFYANAQLNVMMSQRGGGFLPFFGGGGGGGGCGGGGHGGCGGYRH